MLRLAVFWVLCIFSKIQSSFRNRDTCIEVLPSPRPLFFVCEKPHTSVLPKGNFKSYKYINTQVQEYRWSPELDPVTLLEMNNPALQTFWSLLR